MTEQHPKGYRGKGLHVRGGFRVRDISLTFDRTTIAARARDEATAACERGVAAPLENNEEFGPALEQEFRATMVAVGASAFAVDAF
jgi:hypothetical protein